jgi:2-aminoadipate transaminase
MALDPTSLLSARARTTGSSVIRDLLRLLDDPTVLSLAGGLPAPEAMPAERLRVALDRALRADGAYGCPALQYGATEGVPALRALIAEEACALDGRTTHDDVLVTTGSQQALDLLARVLIDPGDVAVVEQPGYLGTIQVLAGAAARLLGVPIDDDGMRTDVLETLLRDGTRPKLVVVVPDFQNPSGARLSAERRMHLGALAERYGFVVVEDDPYRELRFTDDVLPPVRAHTGLAVSLGSSSKTLAPGLRVGWMSGPRALVVPLTRAKQTADLHTSTLAQHAVHDVMADRPFVAAHLDHLRTLYAARADALDAALAEAFGDGIEHRAPRGGFFLWVRLPGADTNALLPQAIGHGVAFVPGAAFSIDGRPTDTARLSFASLAMRDLPTAAQRLARAVGSPVPASI